MQGSGWYQQSHSLGSAERLLSYCFWKLPQARKMMLMLSCMRAVAQQHYHYWVIGCLTFADPQASHRAFACGMMNALQGLLLDLMLVLEKLPGCQPGWHLLSVCRWEGVEHQAAAQTSIDWQVRSNAPDAFSRAYYISCMACMQCASNEVHSLMCRTYCQIHSLMCRTYCQIHQWCSRRAQERQYQSAGLSTSFDASALSLSRLAEMLT